MNQRGDVDDLDAWERSGSSGDPGERRAGGLGERQQGNVPGEHTRGREAGRPS